MIIEYITCHARKVAGGYVVNGSKVFISNGHLSTRIMYSARREPQGLTTWSNDQFKKKTEQSESTLQNSIRLLSTGSSPELAEGLVAGCGSLVLKIDKA
jgi:hypothetical protein